MTDDKRAPISGNAGKLLQENVSAKPQADVQKAQVNVQKPQGSQPNAQVNVQRPQANKLKPQGNAPRPQSTQNPQVNAARPQASAPRPQASAPSSAQAAPSENNQNARALLEELRSLMASINASNKPMSVPIVHYGGSALIRFLGIMVALFGLVVIAGGAWMLVQMLFEIPNTTAILSIVQQCLVPGMIICTGVVLMILGMIAKAICDTSEYNAQLLWVLKQRWERKLK